MPGAMMIPGLRARGLVAGLDGVMRHADVLQQILALGLVTVNCTFPAYGSGHHQSTVPLKNIVPQLKLAYAQRLLYQLAVGTTKISLCFFYLRIFTDTKARLVSYGIMVFVAIYTVALFLTSLLGCIPISDIWSLAPKGKCTGKNGRLMVIYASGAVNIFTDVALLAFIIPRVRKSPHHRATLISTGT